LCSCSFVIAIIFSFYKKFSMALFTHFYHCLSEKQFNVLLLLRASVLFIMTNYYLNQKQQRKILVILELSLLLIEFTLKF